MHKKPTGLDHMTLRAIISAPAKAVGLRVRSFIMPTHFWEGKEGVVC